MKEQIKVSVNGATQAEAYKKILIALGEPVSPLFWVGEKDWTEDMLHYHANNNNWTIGNFEGSMIQPKKEVTLDELVNILTKKYTGHKTEDGVDMYVGMPFYEAKWYHDGWRVEGYYKGTPYVVGENHKNADVVLMPERYKAFSTKEAAQAWISKFTGHVTEDGIPLYLGMIYHRALNRDGKWVKDQKFTWSQISIRSVEKGVLPFKIFSSAEALENWLAKQERNIELDNFGFAKIKGDEIIIGATYPFLASILISRAEFMKIYKALLILVIVLFASCAKEDPLPTDRTTYRVLCDECTVDIGQQGAKFQVKGTWQYTADMLITNPKMIITPVYSQRIKASITPGKQVDVVTDKPVKL